MFHLEPGVLVVPLADKKQTSLWFADPVTQALLLRWHRQHRQDLQYLAELYYTDRAIELYLDYLNDSLSDSVASLRQQIKDRDSLRLPPYLIDYASGKNRSVSLPVTTWQRIYSSKAISTGMLAEQETLTLPKVSEHYSAQPTEKDLRRQIPLLKKLTAQAGQHRDNHADFRRALEDFLEQHASKLAPTLFYVIQWGIELVTHIPSAELMLYPGRDKHKLRPSSALKYMNDIGRDLMTEAGAEDVAEFDGEELHSLYDRSIQLASVRNNSKGTKTIAVRCAEGLYRFHGFMMIRYGALPVDFSDLIESKDKTLDVDANLISYTEYEHVLQVLGSHEGKITDLQQMQLLVVTMGFELGLRRGECMRLRLCDIHLCGDESMLLVQNNRYGQAKSSSSVRKLPIGILLSPLSFQRLANWHNKRTLEVNGACRDALLFCASDNRTAPAQNELFGPIRQALHRVTGDVSLRYHHLRHSFANWVLLRLIRHTLPSLNAPFLDHDVFTKQSCIRFREGLLKNGSLGRKALYELARLLGHESPQTSLFSYIHILDWLLAQSCLDCDCNPELSVAAISNLTGLSQDKLYYWRKTNRSEAIQKSWRVSLILRQIPPIEGAKLAELVEPDLTVIPVLRDNSEEHFLKLRRLIPRALEALHNGEPLENLAQSIDIDPETLIRWQRNVNWIRTLRTSYNKPRHINSNQLKRGVDFFPLSVKTQPQKAMYARIFATFASKSQEKQAELKKFAKFFLLNFSISAKGVQFANEDYLERFFSRLKELGVFEKEICLVSAQLNASHATLEEQKNRLSKAYPQAKAISVISYEGQKVKLQPITVRVINPDDAKNKPESGEYHANYGFRYAMYILATAMFEELDLDFPSGSAAR